MNERSVTVTLTNTPKPRLLRKTRSQPWWWYASAANGQVLAVASERYTNRADAIAALTLLFGDRATIRQENPA